MREPAPCLLLLGDAGGALLDAHWRALTEKPSSDKDLNLVWLVPTAPRLGANVANDLAAAWAEQAWGLLPGWHRLRLGARRLNLTLVIGPVAQSLRAVRIQADALVLAPDAGWPESAVTRWDAQMLARLCRVGAHLSLAFGGSDAVWRAAGFQPGAQDHAMHSEGIDRVDRLWGQLMTPLTYQPNWAVQRSRIGRTPATRVGHCVVVGAGLAGAAVAASMARRGWRVTVLDEADAPAAGASGLPVGLVVDHVSRDDCVLSRLSRVGVRLMRQELQRLLPPGQAWGPGGVLERQVRQKPLLPADWAGLTQANDWCIDAARLPQSPVSAAAQLPALWHPNGAWVKPAALVQAWLATPGVRFQGRCAVAALQPDGDGWHLLGPSRQPAAHADLVVLANASGTLELLSKSELQAQLKQTLEAKIPAIHGMRGMLSWGAHDPADTALPRQPVNGSGSWVAGVPGPLGCFWATGSSYQPADQSPRADALNHAHNLAHLHILLPHAAQAVQTDFAADRVQAWHGVRCVSRDRLPLVGLLNQAEDGRHGGTLAVCTAMGSRGLSLSMLCAELLAAQINAEPWPLGGDLARALYALRA